MSEEKIMDFTNIIVGVVMAVFGWVTVNYFTSKRDVANSKRAIRNSALTEAYKALVRAGIDGDLVYKDKDGNIINCAKAVEDAIAIIHLYGNQEQSLLASEYAIKLSQENNSSVTDIINTLRKDLREDLGLCDLEDEPIYLKVKIQGEKA